MFQKYIAYLRTVDGAVKFLDTDIVKHRKKHIKNDLEFLDALSKDSMNIVMDALKHHIVLPDTKVMSSRLKASLDKSSHSAIDSIHQIDNKINRQIHKIERR